LLVCVVPVAGLCRRRVALTVVFAFLSTCTACILNKVTAASAFTFSNLRLRAGSGHLNLTYLYVKHEYYVNKQHNILWEK
jgi:hypothetical protein